MAQQKASADSLADVKESREWLRTTLASIGDAVITTDANGACTFLNPVAEALTGWTNEQAAGMALPLVFRIVNEDTRKNVENPALRALREGVVVGLANHTLLIARDGTERPIDDSAAPIRNAAGAVAGVVLVFRDISERKAQEKALHDARQLAENIFATLRSPFLVLDADLQVVSANRSFYMTFRVEPAETEGRFLYDLGNGQWNIPELRRLLEDVLPQNHSFEDFEVVREFEGGVGRKTMLLNARRVHKPGDHSQLILLAIEDITARRAAEQALRESEMRYRRLFQTAKDGILIVDAHTAKIVDANKFMESLLGMESGDLLGKELHEIGLFQDAEENKEAFRNLQRTSYLRHEHLPLQNQRGERVQVELIANVYEEDHHLVAQFNVRDISSRVAMEKKIQEQTEALAGESRRKDEFLAMLSHELRNPLAPIRSALHVLKLQERGSENMLQQQARQIIERQVTNLTKLVNDLLEVSRVVTGRVRLDQQIVDVNQVVEHAVETTKPQLIQRRHELVVKLCPEPMWASADAGRLEEVFVNILNNAAKFTDEGGRIEITCEDHRNHVEIRVRDNGVGVDKALLPRIFDLFTQADRSLVRSAGGLGIGLNLAHRLVQLHGGTIEAFSPPEGQHRGSEFVVRLPRTATLAAAQSNAPQGGTGRPEGTRVLVVDDNVDHVVMLVTSLRDKGYSVQSAFTGPEGLEVALKWRPDIVLLDIGLPGMDGYEVARRIRNDPALKPSEQHMRLIALTGYSRDTDVQLAREAGFDAHVAKPSDFGELEKVMATPTVA